MGYYSGTTPFESTKLLKLVKDRENNHDDEAILAEARFAGKVGYVANSPKTVIKGTMSAGRIYDKIDDISFAEVKFYFFGFAIARLLSDDEVNELKKDITNDINFLK